MKIQEVKRILTRWQPSSFTLYREVFTQYGGSINMHPDIVDYFMKRHNWHFKFFHYKEDDKIKGAYFICNDQNIGILRAEPSRYLQMRYLFRWRQIYAASCPIVLTDFRRCISHKYAMPYGNSPERNKIVWSKKRSLLSLKKHAVMNISGFLKKAEV